MVDPREVKHPCNCFGTLGQFELQMYTHEMGKEGCTRSAPSNPTIREFDTGATRDTSHGKLDFEGFFSPLVLHAYGVHMQHHQKDSAGNWRESDNWQKGIPLDAYMKSGWRHFFDWWSNHRDMKVVRKERIIRACCAVMFNVMGYLHEYLKENPEALKAFEKECGYGE